MKRRILAWALALLVLVGSLVWTEAEEKAVADRFVLMAVEVDGEWSPVDGADPDALDVITLYEDGSAVVEMRWLGGLTDGEASAQRIECSWRMVESMSMYTIEIYDELLDVTVSYYLRGEDGGYTFSLRGWGTRLFRREGEAQPTEGWPLPDAAARLTVPFDGPVDIHLTALKVWSSLSEDLIPLDSGEGPGYAWQRYSMKDVSGYTVDTDEWFDIYLILSPDRESVLGYATLWWGNSKGNPLTAFYEASRLVDAGFDGDEEAVKMGRWAKACFEVAQNYDEEREFEEMSALEDAAEKPDFTEGSAYCRYGHYITAVRVYSGDVKGLWLIYHNTPGMDAAQETAAENPEPASAGEWTCENGHGGNTGNFCTECGAQKPAAPAFCPNCGMDLSGLDIKFCTNCGQPLG